MGSARAAALLALLLAPFGATAGPDLLARRPLRSHAPLTASQYEALAEGLPHKDFKVVVKFHDLARFRVGRDGRGSSAVGATPFTSAVEGCAAEVAAAARQLGLATSIRPMFGGIDHGLEALLKRAEERSGRQQPDFRGMVEIAVPGNNATRLVEIRSAFEQIGCTEYTSFSLGPPPLPDVVHQSPKTTCAPACSPGKTCTGVTTGNCTPFYFNECNRNLHEYLDASAFRSWAPKQQGFREADFIDVEYASSKGALGQGVTIADTENGFARFHEALPRSIIINPPYVPAPDVDLAHGTAVQSLLVGNENLPGIAPDAASSFWSNAASYYHSQASVILAAGATLEAGDVMLYEVAWRVDPSCPCAGGTWLADILAEVLPDIWDATKTLTDAGIIVVEAAGNGDVDLDLSYKECDCLGYNLDLWKSWGDSGAIVVGAGSSNEQRAKMDFSSYGARVDIQAWGENVMSADYRGSDCGACTYLEDFAIPGHEEELIQQCDSAYTDKNLTYQQAFAGTSSASTITAGAVAALQSYNTAVLGRPVLLPAEMRQLLVETGAPQGGADAAEKPIGPLIKLRPAMERLAAAAATDARGAAQQARVARHRPEEKREEIDVGSFFQEPAPPAGLVVHAGEL